MCELKVHKFLTRLLSFHHLQGSREDCQALSQLSWSNNSGTKTKPSQSGWTASSQPSQSDKETASSTLSQQRQYPYYVIDHKASHSSHIWAGWLNTQLPSYIFPVTCILNNAFDMRLKLKSANWYPSKSLTQKEIQACQQNQNLRDPNTNIYKLSGYPERQQWWEWLPGRQEHGPCLSIWTQTQVQDPRLEPESFAKLKLACCQDF